MVRTCNELEGGLVSVKLVTRYVVQIKYLGFSWEVPRRYSEFHQMHEALVQEALVRTEDLPPFPPKKYMTSKSSQDVAARMLDLYTYLRALLSCAAVGRSEVLKAFL